MQEITLIVLYCIVLYCIVLYCIESVGSLSECDIFKISIPLSAVGSMWKVRQAQY